MSTMERVLPLAGRMARLGTEGAFEVLARAQQLEQTHGQDIIHLEIGEPDFPTAPHIVEAAARALRDGWTHYGPSAGLNELREAVAEDAGRRRGIRVDPAEVVITPGAKPIYFFAILALIEPDDEVVYPDPGFPIYPSMIRFAGARPVPYPLREENDFDVAAAAVIEKLTHRTRMVILNSPHNPAGGVMARAELQTLAEELARRDVAVFSDEIYSRLLYEGSAASTAQFPALRDRTIILDGFSKTYAMTGWRLGYGIMNPRLAAEVARLMTNSNSCTASFTQRAGIAALQGDQSGVNLMLAEFRRRRAVIVEGLNRIPGIRCRQPRGAFYAFPNIKGTGMRSRELADALLNEAGVACLPGTAFGEGGEGYLRFSFANSVENIRRALGRVERWIREKSSPELPPGTHQK
ncbi:MAG: pyridoxal phosphate-dependent aminotransferase [Candidatus Acidiferrales bacterium]